MAAALPADAHLRYFTYTYDWFTPWEGERELELWWTQTEGGDAVWQLEFEYGVTRQYMVAPYLIFEREGGKTVLKGWKLEQRYAFGEQVYERVLPAVYLEVKKERGEPYEIEAKLIGTYILETGWVISANLIAERELASGAKVEWGYAAGVSRRISRNAWFGGEVFGDFAKNRHFIGPVAAWDVRRGQRLLGTVAVSLTGGPGQARLIYEYEF